MNKIERHGQIAVLVSPGYGAGWSTWNDKHREVLCMDAEIVQAVLDGDKAKAEQIAKAKTEKHLYCGGLDDTKVQWIPKGSIFEISEYDGYESLRLIDNAEFLVA